MDAQNFPFRGQSAMEKFPFTKQNHLQVSNVHNNLLPIFSDEIIKKKLGEGSFGTVLLIESTKPGGKSFARKIFLNASGGNGSADVEHRFLRLALTTNSEFLIKILV